MKILFYDIHLCDFLLDNSKILGLHETNTKKLNIKYFYLAKEEHTKFFFIFQIYTEYNVYL